jgi:hypothetical protein
MLEMGIPREVVEETCYLNALRAYGQSGQIRESDWAEPVLPADTSGTFQGNSVARGQPLA